MPNLSIKNVPVDVVEHLRSRARANHRSLQGELLALVNAAVEPPVAGRESGLQIHRRERGSRTAEQIWESIRAKHPEPVGDAPRAVDIIRADRDGR